MLYHLAVRDVRNAVMALKDDRKCRYCGKDDKVVKKGVRYNKSGPLLKKCKQIQRHYANVFFNLQLSF